MICVDHWPNRLTGYAGHPVIQSPTLDQLAECGTVFTNAYSECPVCIPARRTQMTGTLPKTHGDRIYKGRLAMPEIPTLAQCFRDSGYQAYGSGKLHVYPQRNRIGFDDVMLAEEGRTQFGVVDDYELYLGEQGYPGAQWFHGMCNNDYLTRPWHLDEKHHVTNWTTREMVRFIKRRDPTRPGFWYCSYCHPHPPLVPPQAYLDMYAPKEIDMPEIARWAEDTENLPTALRSLAETRRRFSPKMIREARRAFYALCTHIDHQLRIVIGTLREEGLLNNTIILFTGDHGDMLGTNGMWAKRVFYEYSANIPMILVGPPGDNRIGEGNIDNRLVGLADVMPTLLGLAGIESPETVEGISMVDREKRDHLYGEFGDDETVSKSRMIRTGQHKLIYYPFGNVVQLFDMLTDPGEKNDLSADPAHSEILADLTARLESELYGGDEQWITNGKRVGLPDKAYDHLGDRGLHGQRGGHWPIQPSAGSEGY